MLCYDYTLLAFFSCWLEPDPLGNEDSIVLLTIDVMCIGKCVWWRGGGKPRRSCCYRRENTITLSFMIVHGIR